MKVGELSLKEHANEDTGEIRAIFEGRIDTMDFNARCRLVPAAEKRSDQSPDFALQAYQRRSDRWVAVGSAWRKEALATGQNYLSIAVTVPGLAPFNVAAFLADNQPDANEPTNYNVVYSPGKSSPTDLGGPWS